jgi:hypothetical protein
MFCKLTLHSIVVEKAAEATVARVPLVSWHVVHLTIDAHTASRNTIGTPMVCSRGSAYGNSLRMARSPMFD